MMNWLRRLFRRADFPEPKAHNLPLAEVFRFYHKKLNGQQRSECKILVYRMDPAKAPFKTLLKLASLPRAQADLLGMIDTELMPPLTWWRESSVLWSAAFCIRLQRTWKTQTGSKTKEICISIVELEVEHGAESEAAALPETLSAQGKDGPKA